MSATGAGVIWQQWGACTYPGKPVAGAPGSSFRHAARAPLVLYRFLDADAGGRRGGREPGGGQRLGVGERDAEGLELV